MADLIITGYEPTPTNDKRGQVYMATHKGQDYLPFMNRSFISFSFGGKNIEDYNLIATISGDRMKRNGMADFEDLVTSYDILDGQFYWGTTYRNNQLDLTLSTDGITQAQLDDFLYWFAGGKIRELILAEHPNRAIMARVAAPPALALLPFEQKVNLTLSKINYTTSTTLYKGDINISFVMDDPYWYSIVNIFGYKDSRGVYHDEWTDANGRTINVLDPSVNKDALKIVLEDGIPISSMIAASMILGNNIYANLDDANAAGRIARDTIFVTLTKDGTNIVTYIRTGELTQNIMYTFTLPDEQLSIDAIEPYFESLNKATTSVDSSFTIYIDENTSSRDRLEYMFNQVLEHEGVSSWTYADKDTTEQCIIASVVNNVIYGARIAGVRMDESTGIAQMHANDIEYLYYCGTAPSPVKLTFTLTPIINNSHFISVPNNTYASEGEVPYNTFTLESVNKSVLQFTTPGIYTSYNKVIDMFSQLQAGSDWAAIRQAIRVDVHHAAVRAWANKVIDYLDSGAVGIIQSNDATLSQAYMEYMFKTKGINATCLSGTYVFDSKNGKATAKIKYRVSNSAVPSNTADWATYGTIMNENNNVKEEDVGDMLKSNYLIIRDRNYPDKQTLSINRWAEYQKDASHRIYHDVSNGLSNVNIEYKNLYL